MVHIEFHDLIDYATKKYDVEDHEALAWCEWLVDTGVNARTSFNLDELYTITPKSLDCSENHPQWLAHRAMRDYMDDFKLNSVILLR